MEYEEQVKLQNRRAVIDKIVNLNQKDFESSVDKLSQEQKKLILDSLFKTKQYYEGIIGWIAGVQKAIEDKDEENAKSEKSVTKTGKGNYIVEEAREKHAVLIQKGKYLAGVINSQK